MMGQSLGMVSRSSNLPPEYVARMKPLVAAWEKPSAIACTAARFCPVGDAPDGRGRGTGFVFGPLRTAKEAMRCCFRELKLTGGNMPWRLSHRTRARASCPLASYAETLRGRLYWAGRGNGPRVADGRGLWSNVPEKARLLSG